MIDFKLLRSELHITKSELAEVARITGISRFRSAMVERGLLTFNPTEESTLRLAVAYMMHRRSFRLAAKLAQSQSPSLEPMTWDEYVRTHREKKQ